MHTACCSDQSAPVWQYPRVDEVCVVHGGLGLGIFVTHSTDGMLCLLCTKCMGEVGGSVCGWECVCG